MSVFALVEKLTPRIEEELNLVIKTEQESKSLSTKLKEIQQVLQNAERIGVTDEGVKNWLKKLEDVTNEMDDVLDEWATAKLQVEVQDTSLTWDKVRSLLDSLCLCFKQVVSRREITQKMKALSEKIDVIVSEKDKYKFDTSDDNSTQKYKQEESTSLVSKNNKFYGLEKVKDSLVKKIVSEGEESDKDTQIISIVGVGGVGKTTLARVAYNDPEVDRLFAPKGWVSVSQSFDALVIAKAILESFGGKSEDAHKLETLVRRIREAVKNKRFLLVLDNVWTEDRNKWQSLRDSLDGGKGSRIVVTTRLESVGRMMGTVHWQTLGLLSDSDCGMILNGVALEGRPKEECQKLRSIGMDIAKKCNGLPLAARSVGSMLALKSSEREWRDVLKSPLWKDEDKATDLFHLLNLSLLDLSPVIKRCLLSTVIFPKDTSLTIDEISREWMAYGYLNSNGSVDEVESKGSQYFRNLAVRSFFQRVESDDEFDRNTVLYKMHDIIHDFVGYLSVSDGYSFIMDGGLENEKSSSFQSGPDYNSLGCFHTCSVCKIKLSHNIVSHLTRVRVLCMRECNLEGLPEDIGKLIHLRYLNVSYNPIRELPGTITDLCNLQTLDIAKCKSLSSLPEGMQKLINLRHLVNCGTESLSELPHGLAKLSKLRTLSEIRGRKLGCLRNLNQLQGSLTLFVSIKDFDEGEFVELNLWEKKHIEILGLEFDREEMDEMVEALKPPPNLRTLRVAGGSGKWLSHWIKSFDNLKVIEYNCSRKSSELPPFCKLPALEELTIEDCNLRRLSVGFLGLEGASSSSTRQVAGGFPRMKKLRFKACRDWKEWEDIEQDSSVPPVFPSLEKLQFRDCDELKRLPLNLLGKATSLRLVTISNSGYLERFGYDRDKIRQLPNVTWNIESCIRASFLTYTAAIHFINAAQTVTK